MLEGFDAIADGAMCRAAFLPIREGECAEFFDVKGRAIGSAQRRMQTVPPEAGARRVGESGWNEEDTRDPERPKRRPDVFGEIRVAVIEGEEDGARREPVGAASAAGHGAQARRRRGVVHAVVVAVWVAGWQWWWRWVVASTM